MTKKTSKTKTKEKPVDEIKVKIEEDQKPWVEKYQGDYAKQVGNQGKVEGSAMEFVRQTVLPKYFERFYPSVTEDVKQRMSDCARRALYHYLRNINERGSGVGEDDEKKVDVVNLWAKDEANEEVVEALFDQFHEENDMSDDDTISVQQWRKVTCAAFHKLPGDVKQEYEDRAEQLREKKRQKKVLKGAERLVFAKGFAGDLRRFIQKAEEKAGVLVVARVAYEVSDVGAMEITSVTSKAAKDYKKTNGHADSMVNWGDWLRETENKTVKRDKPLPAVYPDRKNENFPLVPDLGESPVLSVKRKVVRGYISVLWQRLLGSGPVPWKEINTSFMKGEHRFVEKERQPPGYPLMDPSEMISESVDVWIDWILRPQEKRGDKSTWFTFSLVFASTRKALPENSAAIRMTEAQRGNSKVLEIEYDGWVEKCQAGGNIRFPEESLDFEQYLIGQGIAQTNREHPHWKGLTSGDPSDALPGISPEGCDFIFSLLANLADAEKTIVERLVESLNKMYSLLPAEDEKGLWADDPTSVASALGLPAMLPATTVDLPEAIDFLRAYWVPTDYFRPAFQVDEKSRIDHLEGWQYRLIAEDFLRHAESGTLLGGKYGLRWGVLGIIKFLLNVGALTGKIAAPVPQPEGINSRRASDGLWDSVLEWCDTWTTAIQSTISILEETYAERARPFLQDESEGGQLLSSHAASEVLHQKDTASRSPSPGQSPPPRRKLRPKPAYALKPPSNATNEGSGSDPHGCSDDEGDASDTFQPPESDEEEPDEEEQDNGQANAKGQTKGTNHGIGTKGNKKKGKQTAQGERDVDLLHAKFISRHVSTGSISELNQYEAECGLVQPNIAQGPVADILLTEHPLGPMPDSAPLGVWEGTISELQEECKAVIKDARLALLAISENSQEPYHDDDDAKALKMATKSGMKAKPLLAVIFKQRIVWERAQRIWPTMQYQYKHFMELSKRTFRLIPLLNSCLHSAPQELVESLNALLKRLERTSYRVRFIYQELHDLGVVSKHYFSLLEPGWDDPKYVWDLADLQAAVDSILQWSDDTQAVLRWHRESRQKTWEIRKEDNETSPMPEGCWYRFGNPGPQSESEEVKDWLSRGNSKSCTRGGQHPKGKWISYLTPAAQLTCTTTDTSHNAHHDKTSATDISATEDVAVDEMSPEAKDRAALELLREDDDEGTPESKDVGHNDVPPKRRKRTVGAGTGTSETKDGGDNEVPPKQKKGTVGARTAGAKRKKSLETQPAEPARATKKNKVSTMSTTNASESGGPSGTRTRTGRMVKPSEKARG